MSADPYFQYASGNGDNTPFGKLGTPALSSLRNDPTAYKADINSSVGPGQYVLSPVVPSCRPCLNVDPRIAAQRVGDSLCQAQSIVDTESDLMNLSRRATRDPSGLYRGDGSDPIVCGKPGGSTMPYPICDGIPTVDTRLVNPPCTLRGTGINRFEWLCRDPQEHALMPFDACIDTSIVTKDAHRPFIARPLDPTMALPPGKHDAPSTGAPQWIPKLNGVGPVNEPPLMLYRSCQEVDRISNGCR